MVWYSHLFQNFPQFVVIHTVKGFGIVSKVIDVFLELSCFFDDLSIAVSGVLKSPTIIVLLSISPFMSVSVCLCQSF